MKVVYICASGANDPTRASMSFHLALNGSLEVGDDVRIVLGGDAGELVVGDAIDKVEGVGLPPLRELVAKARDRQVPVDV